MKNKKIIFGIGISIMFLVPLILIIIISSIEIESYKIKDKETIISKSYGEPEKILRTDIEETIRLQGEVKSLHSKNIELHNEEEDRITILKNVDEEIFKGDTIGYKNKEAIISPYNGKIIEVNVSHDGYLRIQTFDELVFQSKVDVNFPYSKFVTVDGKAELKLRQLSNIIVDNKRTAYFDIKGKKINYGEKIDVAVVTGKKEAGILTVSASCIYQKEAGGKFYVRIINIKGDFLEEREVEIGIGNLNMMAITGVKEHEYCDSGYKIVIESSWREMRKNETDNS